jgi:uncharacterized YkwD family protein
MKSIKAFFFCICFGSIILNGCNFVPKREVNYKRHAAETSIDFVTMHNYVGKLYTAMIFPSTENESPLSAAATNISRFQDVTVDNQNGQTKKQMTAHEMELKNNTVKKHSTTSTLNSFESEVIELTNSEREKNGLPALQVDTTLCEIAKLKSKDMHTNNYFSHTSPTYGSPFNMISTYGISYHSAGENVAKGQLTPEQFVQSTLNSYGNRQNILSSDFTHVGIGYEDSGLVLTQLFIKK